MSAPIPAPAPARSPERLGGLRRFAVAITVLNVLGHGWFGFEQSILQPLVALAAAYATELGLDRIDAWANRRKPRFAGPLRGRVDFLLSAHISGLAVAMLLYASDRLWVIAFAASMAIASKTLFRAPGGVAPHFFNPSNIGITATLLLFPWVGIAPPYQFTERLDAGDWVLPALIVCSGTFLNWRFTKRLPLIAAWLTVFAAQAVVRTQLDGTATLAALLPMTGVAFILFTFYMVTDPATTPSEPRAQVAFGAGVALAYCALMQFHVVFGLFFALSIVCALRGGVLCARAWLAAAERARVPSPAAVPRPVGAGSAAVLPLGDRVAMAEREP
ncbi:MAG TPA: hypothetical protein VF746_09800 [Longimicrobium sp.]|jgi:hypothetical protein